MGFSSGMYAPVGTGAAMYRPGAERSGFMKPSAVGPYADHDARVSSLRPIVPSVSSAPTVMMNGSFPGAAIFTGPDDEPLLPTAATTTTPLIQSSSTALSSGSNRKLDSLEPASEKFATRMLYRDLFAIIQSTAEMMSLVLASPSLDATRTSTSGAFFATPG